MYGHQNRDSHSRISACVFQKIRVFLFFVMFFYFFVKKHFGSAVIFLPMCLKKMKILTLAPIL